MSLITNLAPATETEAVNAMLASIGEAAVSDLTSSQSDLEMAINLLGDATRNVQAAGWRFNTFFEVALAPTAQIAWTDTDDLTFQSQQLYVFVKPSGVATFRVSPRPDQYGVDVVERMSEVFRVGSAPGVPAMCLYDRARNRDGFPVSERHFLYLDLVRYYDFEQIPQSARAYITMVAARQLAEKAMGSAERSKFTERDEALSLRLFRRDQGMRDKLNIITQPGDMVPMLMHRPALQTGTNTARRYWR